MLDFGDVFSTSNLCSVIGGGTIEKKIEGLPSPPPEKNFNYIISLVSV